MTSSKDQSIIILIGGGHAVGKRSTACMLADEISKTFPSDGIAVKKIDLKNFEEKPESNNSNIAFSSKLKPYRFNFEKVCELLSKEKESSLDHPQKIFLIYGLYALYDKNLRDLSQIKVFISSDPDTRLIRWIKRDVLNGSTTLEQVILTYVRQAREEMNDYIFPTKTFADVIMPHGADPNAVKLILDGIVPFLRNKTAESLYTPFQHENYLRPGDNNFFDHDDQKGTFYELN